MTTFDFSGQRAIVTGGARGIGLSVAEMFLKCGAQVEIWDVLNDALEEAENQLSPFGVVSARFVDVTDYPSVEIAAEGAGEHLGGVEILVNAAGIVGQTAPVVDYPVDEWDRVIGINLTGIFHTCRAVLPWMQDTGYGRIANIASIAGKEGNPNAPAYSASKAGVIGFTKSLGKELATTNIKVNALTPAVIGTPMLLDMPQDQIDYMLAKIPMGRMGGLEEVASMIAWMCSPECSFTTGAVFDLSGGRATY